MNFYCANQLPLIFFMGCSRAFGGGSRANVRSQRLPPVAATITIPLLFFKKKVELKIVKIALVENKQYTVLNTNTFIVTKIQSKNCIYGSIFNIYCLDISSQQR
jgi:hypothetical protein